MDVLGDAYASLFRRVLYPAWERLRHRPPLERLSYLERTQWRSPDELMALQLRGLRRLLQHAYDHVPAYRYRMEAADLVPGEVRDLADFRRLRPLRRAEIQDARHEFLAAGDPGRIVKKSTSGSTGTPFRFCYSYESEIWRQAMKLRGYGWAGYLPGMRTVHYWGPPAQEAHGLHAAKIGLDRALHREVYLDCARQGDADLYEACATLRRLRPQVLIGYTQATVQLGRFVLAHALRDWPAMRVLCGAERLFPQDRVILEEAFGEAGSVFETYGCREFMLIASECEAHQGLHQSMETLLCEVVDDDGQEVPPGMVGQVAVTDLYNHAMPLIRYLTGDLAIAAAPGERCSCGRGLLRLTSVEGRQQDLLHGAAGQTIPGMLFVAIFANLGEKVRQFQAVQHRDGGVDLRVVPGPEFDGSVVEGLRTRLSPYFQGLPLSVQLVPSVPPLPSGKRQFIVVEQ